MHKTTTLSITLALTLLVATPVTANDDYSEDYVALGVGGQAGLILFPASDDSPFTQNGIPPIGGVTFTNTGGWNNVIIDLEDAASENPPTSTCFWNPDGDNICNEDDNATGAQCGGATHIGSPFPIHTVTVFIFNVHVTPDLDTCFGTTGTATAHFF